jgi:putative two-component system protein, hydrogenase maturation factor HypX/HoxX
MKILLLATANNSLCQRLAIQLVDRDHCVAVAVAGSGDEMLHSVSSHSPDLIIAPMLKSAIPEAIWSRHICLVVHPGIEGDRGPSSLDWAIAKGERSWGVTILQAEAEMDAGPVWATREFPLPETPVTKSSLYRNQVTEAAVAGVLEAVARIDAGKGRPAATARDIRGSARPPMRQKDRAIYWGRDGTDAIVRTIAAADSAPGVLGDLFGENYYIYGAHAEDRLRGAPGVVLAQRDGAICRATVDGSVWITHLKAKANDGFPGLKLPAVQALGRRATRLPKSELPFDASVEGRTWREIRYVERGAVGYLHFDFYNGAMSTEQCRRLRDAFIHARRRPTRVIALLGGRDFFSNGIHLNVIEAGDSAMESWRNINAIDDLVREILTTASHLVVAGLRGNAGAGGAMLALAADLVLARRGVVLNPHYKGMGGLHGSEYWTYTLPRRVGSARAIALTEACRPIGVIEAKRIGLIDDSFGFSVGDFEGVFADRVAGLSQRKDFWRLLREKHERRLSDERRKSLGSYREEELEHMHANFFGADPAYHMARKRFVYKGAAPLLSRKAVELPCAGAS